MKFTLGELRIMMGSLGKLSSADLPLKYSWRISKLQQKIIEVSKIIEDERVRLVKKYGEKKEDSDIYEVKPDKSVEFRKEFGDFLSEEIEIDFLPINVSEIIDVKISASDIGRLGKILVGDISL